MVRQGQSARSHTPRARNGVGGPVLWFRRTKTTNVGHSSRSSRTSAAGVGSLCTCWMCDESGPVALAYPAGEMTYLLRVLRIGADQRDAEDVRLRKVLVLSAAMMVALAAGIWGAIYWMFDEPLAAAVPWSYVVFTAVSVAVLAKTRAYLPFAVGHFVALVILPFALMWVLGGFIAGSAVALWAWLAPFGARMVGHRRGSLLLFVAVAAGFVLSAAAHDLLRADYQLPDSVVLVFFVLNLTAVGAVTLVLIDASAGGREGTVASMTGIVRRYFSPDVADAILSDPSRQELGGDVVDVTVLFADLGGYTTYAANRTPDEVVGLLNSLFAAAVPSILAHGGTPVHLPGDAVMAVFGAPRAAPDHAVRAARAALAIQERSAALADQHPHWPRFRIGLNSGETLVGNIGSAEFRNFTAIGDTVNMAQRFQTLAKPGQVVLGPGTASNLRDEADLESLGDVLVKGKTEPIRPSVLLSVATDR